MGCLNTNHVIFRVPEPRTGIGISGSSAAMLFADHFLESIPQSRPSLRRSFRRRLIELKPPNLELSTTHTSENVHRDSLILLLDARRLLAAFLKFIASEKVWLGSGRFAQARHAIFGSLLAIVYVVLYSQSCDICVPCTCNEPWKELRGFVRMFGRASKP